MLSGFFAVLGLILAAVGLYGVLSYAVVRRTREIGIRLALGARAASVLDQLRAVFGAVSAGIVAGLAGGVYFARFVQKLLYETEPVSLSSLGLPVLCLSLVALAATWQPLRRATRVDPAEALEPTDLRLPDHESIACVARLNAVVSTDRERAQRASHAIGASRRSGERERV